ncbi:MAG TPA: sigma-70 family RNA polymerase sigma factor [Limnochordia bacterium]
MDEWALVRRAQAGDASAFAALVYSYGRFVRSLARRYMGGLDAEDAAQEVWLAVYTKLWQVREPGKFLPWLRTLCYYRCLDYCKARARHRRWESLLTERAWRALVEQVADSEYRVEELLERRELRCLISRELDCLPGDYGAPMDIWPGSPGPAA